MQVDIRLTPCVESACVVNSLKVQCSFRPLVSNVNRAPPYTVAGVYVLQSLACAASFASALSTSGSNTGNAGMVVALSLLAWMIVTPAYIGKAEVLVDTSG